MRAHLPYLGFALATLAGCKYTRDNPNHCQNQPGNDWCAERYPDGSAPYCAIGKCMPDVPDGCVAERPADDACYSPCGFDATFEDDPSCDGVADTGSSGPTTTVSMTEPTQTSSDPTTMSTMSMSDSESESESETEPTSATEPTTGPTGCVASLECGDPQAPICDDMACVPCTDLGDGDAACAAKDPATPACRDDGACVECTLSSAALCEGATPVCDPGTSACAPCTYHEQCATDACHMATGECFDDTCRVEVDGDGGADAETISEAIGDGCVIIVHDAVGGYSENVVIDGGELVAVIAAEGEAPVIGGIDGNALPTVEIAGSSVVYLQGVEVSGNSGLGVDVSGAEVRIDRARIVDNSGIGLRLDAAEAVLRNSFVAGAGGATPAVDANGGTLDIIYGTLGGLGINAIALDCSGGAVVNVRNSIIVAEDDAPEIACAGAVLTNTATETGPAVNGNVALGDMDPAWFEGFAAGNFLLLPAGAIVFADIAEWTPVDPSVDIEGDPRPSEMGPDVAGADVE